MAYRVGHHSTSDDSTAYRSAEEIEVWQNAENPIGKLRNYLKHRGWWNEQEETAYMQDVRKEVLKQINESERKPKPNWREMFNDVYNDMPVHLRWVYIF